MQLLGSGRVWQSPSFVPLLVGILCASGFVLGVLEILFCIGHEKSFVPDNIVGCFAEAGRFSLGFISSGLVGLGALEEVGGGGHQGTSWKVMLRRSRAHCPSWVGCQVVGNLLAQLVGGENVEFQRILRKLRLGGGATAVSAIGRWSLRVPRYPGLGSEVWGSEKEIDYNWLFLLGFRWPWGSGDPWGVNVLGTLRSWVVKRSRMAAARLASHGRSPVPTSVPIRVPSLESCVLRSSPPSKRHPGVAWTRVCKSCERVSRALINASWPRGAEGR